MSLSGSKSVRPDKLCVIMLVSKWGSARSENENGNMSEDEYGDMRERTAKLRTDIDSGQVCFIN